MTDPLFQQPRSGSADGAPGDPRLWERPADAATAEAWIAQTAAACRDCPSNGRDGAAPCVGARCGYWRREHSAKVVLGMVTEEKIL